MDELKRRPPRCVGLILLPSSTLVTALTVRPASALAASPRTVVRPAGIPVGVPYLGYMAIYSQWSNPGQNCLDGQPTSGGVNGAKVQVRDSNGSEGWDVYEHAGSGNYDLVGRKFYMCLDADMTTIRRNGTELHLWACNGWDNQQWSPTVGSGPINQHIFSGAAVAGRYNSLDADDNHGFVNGAKVQLRQTLGGSNLVWGTDTSGVAA